MKPLIPKTLPEFVKRAKTGIARDTPPRRPCNGAEVVIGCGAIGWGGIADGNGGLKCKRDDLERPTLLFCLLMSAVSALMTNGRFLTAGSRSPTQYGRSVRQVWLRLHPVGMSQDSFVYFACVIADHSLFRPTRLNPICTVRAPRRT